MIDSIALLAVLGIGLVNGFLVAYADVPAIFATLASGSFVFGYVRSQLITQDAIAIPPGHWLETLGGVRILDIPAEVFIFGGACFIAYLFSGHSGIYLSQRVGIAKNGSDEHLRGKSLRELRAVSSPPAKETGDSQQTLDH